MIHVPGWWVPFIKDFSVTLSPLIRDMRFIFQSNGKLIPYWQVSYMKKCRKQEKISTNYSEQLVSQQTNLLWASIRSLKWYIIDPRSVQSIFNSGKKNAKTWQDFMHRAESVCYMEFLDSTPFRMEKMAYITKQNVANTKSFLLHGNDNHETVNCFTIKSFMRREKK